MVENEYFNGPLMLIVSNNAKKITLCKSAQEKPNTFTVVCIDIIVPQCVKN